MPPLIRPGKPWYLVGAGLLLLGALAGWRFHESRMSAVASGLTRVVVPGTGEVEMPSGGHGSIFLEHRSRVGNRLFLTSPEAPGLRCTLTGPAGEEIPLDTAWLPLGYSGEAREGTILYDFRAPGPGRYRLTAAYAQGAGGSSVVLAAGPGFLGDLSAPIVGGLAVSVGSATAGLAAWWLVWWRRQRYRRRIYGRFS